MIRSTSVVTLSCLSTRTLYTMDSTRPRLWTRSLVIRSPMSSGLRGRYQVGDTFPSRTPGRPVRVGGRLHGSPEHLESYHDVVYKRLFSLSWRNRLYSTIPDTVRVPLDSHSCVLRIPYPNSSIRVLPDLLL